MKAETIYRKYFKELADDFCEQHDRAFRKRFKDIVLNAINGGLYMGLHVMEISKEDGLICEMAYYGAGGKWEDLV